MTKEIVTAAKAMGLMVHDHLVIGKGKHASFKSGQSLEGRMSLNVDCWQEMIIIKGSIHP
jgi:hypothetical protein